MERSAEIETAVEAGAVAWHESVQSQRMDSGRHAPEGGPWRWHHLTETDKRAYRALVRPIVTAALRSVEGTGPQRQSPTPRDAQPQPSPQPTPRPEPGQNEAGCASASRGTPGDMELAVGVPGAGTRGVAVAEDDLTELVTVNRGDGHAVLVEAVAGENFGCGDEGLGHGSIVHRVDTRVNTLKEDSREGLLNNPPAPTTDGERP